MSGECSREKGGILKWFAASLPGRAAAVLACTRQKHRVWASACVSFSSPSGKCAHQANLAMLPRSDHPQTRLRKAIYTAIRTFQAKHGLAEPRDMIDVRGWPALCCIL